MERQGKDTKKVRDTVNIIFNYCDCDVLAKIRKPHSLLAIYFLKCDDPYKVDEVTFLVNTGAVTYSRQLSNPDLPDRVHSYTSQGYNVEFIDSQLTIN